MPKYDAAYGTLSCDSYRNRKECLSCVLLQQELTKCKRLPRSFAAGVFRSVTVIDDCKSHIIL